MKKVLFLALLAVALVAMPAFASVQNVKVSGEIDSTYVSRQEFDLGHIVGANDGLQKQSFFMTQTTLRVDADLTDKVSTTVQLLSERTWGNEGLDNAGNALADSNSAAEVDLNLAYVTIKEMLYSPLTVIVGRQAFAYGNSFVIDSEGPNRTVTAGGLLGVAGDLSKRRALDAIRAVLDYNPLTIDLVYAKVTQRNSLSTGMTQDDTTLLGTNVNYKLGDKYNTVVEGYFWTKLDNAVSGAGGVKTDTVYMPGARFSLNPIQDLNVQGELAFQSGNLARAAGTNVKRNAYAYQGIANYNLPFEQTKKYAPVATVAYTYYSGDKLPTTGTAHYNGWDPMFENQGRGKIYNTLFNMTNSAITTYKGTIKPIEDVTASIELNSIWLAKKWPTGVNYTSLWQPDGTDITAAILNANRKERHLGNEVDLGLSYAYTEDVTIGASLGAFLPGKAFDTNHQKMASQALVNLDVKF